jgi:hypothetical protein
MTIPTDLFRIAWSLKTVPGIRRLLFGLSAQGGGFDPARVNKIFMVKTVFSHNTSGFPCQSSFLHSPSSSSSSSVISRYKRAESGTLQTKQRPYRRRQDWVHKFVTYKHKDGMCTGWYLDGGSVLGRRFVLRVAIQGAVTKQDIRVRFNIPSGTTSPMTVSHTVNTTAVTTSNLALWHRNFDIHSYCFVDEVAQSLQWLATDWMVRGSKLGRSYRRIPSPKLADRLWVPPNLIFDLNLGSFPRVKLPKREAHD